MFKCWIYIYDEKLRKALRCALQYLKQTKFHRFSCLFIVVVIIISKFFIIKFIKRYLKKKKKNHIRFQSFKLVDKLHSIENILKSSRHNTRLSMKSNVFFLTQQQQQQQNVDNHTLFSGPVIVYVLPAFVHP
jgi:Flp pilus assembly protein TadB